jgi:DNA replication and repair protein RecF
MHLTHLSLTNFRNFARLDIDVPRGSALIVGANGQGKTSLLEAIYFLATFTSFHASTDRELINFLAAREPLAVARIIANFNRESADHRLEVRIIQEANGFSDSSRVRKEVLLDGVKNKISEVVGRFNAVLFLPQMLSIIEGSPDERRRYLNLALAQVKPHYPDLLSHYGRALGQRNALLKQIGEFGGDPDQLAYWDDQLVTSGAQLIRARIQAVQELEHLAARVHHELTRGGEVLRLDYQPAYDPLPQPPGQYSLPLDAPVSRSGISLEQIRSGFLEQLMEQRGEEIARGVTTIGPHRDELRFFESGIDLGTYGSRGQVRTAMLALKLAEAIWMKARTGQAPVLLLDEVLAELDTNRRSDLLSRLTMSEQALLTTTDLDLFTPEFVQQATLWKVEAGRLALSS